MRRPGILLALLALTLVAVAPLAAQDTTSTPEAGTTATEAEPVSAVTPEATAQPRPPTGHIRIAHLSFDTPPFETYVNGDLSAIQQVSYPNVTGWVEMPAGTYEIAFVPIGQPLDQAMLGPTTYALAENAWVTIAAVGSFEGKTLSAPVVTENYTGIPTDTARVTFFNALPGSAPVNLIVTSNGGENFNLDGVQFGAARTIDVPSGASNVRIVTSAGQPLPNSTEAAMTATEEATATEAAMSTEAAATAESTSEMVTRSLPLAEFGAQTLNAGSFYFLALTGTAAKPETLWNEVTSSQLTAFLPPLKGHIIDVAADDGRFTALLSALDAAGLTDTLKGDGPFTVFAPVDAAFAAVPNLNDLMAQPDTLRQILLYHVHSGVLNAQQIYASSSLDTLEGSPLTISVSGQKGFVNGDAQMIVADIPATNGVIHVINRVLMPPDLNTAAETMEATAAAP